MKLILGLLRYRIRVKVFQTGLATPYLRQIGCHPLPAWIQPWNPSQERKRMLLGCQ